jgi:hypothetical protein
LTAEQRLESPKARDGNKTLKKAKLKGAKEEKLLIQTQPIYQPVCHPAERQDQLQQVESKLQSAM